MSYITIPKLKAASLDGKAKALIDIIQEDPFKYPPQYEALKGDMEGFYSRRINVQHRLIYQVLDDTKTIRILRMWTHYE